MALWRYIILLYALIHVDNASRGDKSEIKINEPRASYSNNDNNNNNNYQSNNNAASSAQYRDPHSMTENSELVTPSVVEYLTERKDEQIEGTHDKYTYKVDLFNKVEQSENWYSWNLGIFDKWDYCNSDQNELCLIFSDGQVCGNGVGRASYIHFVCDIDDDKDSSLEHLYDVSEPLTCQYHLKLYIPHICELIGNDINNIFAENAGNIRLSKSKEEDKNVNVDGGVINFIGDTSEIMSKLNELINQQNNDKKLDKLWKLCLMSLIVDDDDKLNKIQRAANIYMTKHDEDEDEDDDEDIDTSVCDYYLEQMLIENDDIVSKRYDEDISTDDDVEDNKGEQQKEEEEEEEEEETEEEEQQNEVDEESGGGDATGGLIGSLLIDNDESNNGDNVVVFQSGDANEDNN